MNTEELVEKYTAQGKPWIIIKSYTSFVGETYPCYHIVVSPHGIEGKEITKSEMLLLVKKHEMELAFQSNGEKIWELPGCPFRARYANIFAAKSKKAAERKRLKRQKERERKKRIAKIKERIAKGTNI